MSIMSQCTHSQSITFNDQRRAAALFNKIALFHLIDYALIGSFAIQLMTLAQCVGFIEILVHPHTLNDLLDSITTLNSDVFVRDTERWMINVGGEKYVTLRFVTTGSNNYPSLFMPPWGSPARDVPDFPSGTPNIFFLSLGLGPPDVVLPVLLPKYMLQKRIFDLETYPGDPHDDYRRCLDEIDLLLVCAHIFPSSFSPDSRGALIPVVRQHLVNVSRRKSIWEFLGLDLKFKLAEEAEMTTPPMVWEKERPGVVYVNPRLTTIEETKVVVWNSDSHENKPLTITAFREYPVYSCIFRLTQEQIRHVILCWNVIAKENDIDYAFIGQVAAWLKGHDGIVFQLEVLMEEDGLQKLQTAALKEIEKLHGRKLAITPTNKHIVVIDHRFLVGVAGRFFTVGKDGYPASMVTQNVAIPLRDGSGEDVPVLDKDALLKQVRLDLRRLEYQRHVHATRKEIDDDPEYTILTHIRRFWEGKKTQIKPKKNRGKVYSSNGRGKPRRRG